MATKKPSKAAYIRAHKATIEEANRRIAELRAAGIKTPAYEQLAAYTKGNRRVRFNKNLDLETLQKSLTYAKKFIKAKSSTIKGMEDIRVTHDTILGDIAKQYGQKGLAENTDDVYRVLGSLQWQRSQKTLDSNVVFAYVNKQVDAGKNTNYIKGQITRAMREISENKVKDANAYIREKWGI